MKVELRNLLATIMLGVCLGAPASAQESGSGDDGQAISPAMQKSMDPNVWIKLMNSMMSGQLQGQPMIASCVECHSAEEIARYQQQFGPMMQSMQPMMQMANPQIYGQMPGAMMAPLGGMMAPMSSMMTPMMAPMTGMMAPMGNMMMPMTGMMMNPMTGMMMNPMTGMMMMPGMMPGMPPTGMMPGMPPAGMMPGMPPTGMMPGFPSLPHPGGPVAPGTKPGQPQIMDPKQYEQFYKQWQDMMSKMMPSQPGASSGQQ